MKAIQLVKYGNSEQAFKQVDIDAPKPEPHQVLIEVEAFGLNYADVMARAGLYDDAPPIPCVLGYEVVGRVTEIGKDVTTISVGDRVTALTRFGGYAQFAVTDERAACRIPDDMDTGVAVAIATQYCTAYHAACDLINLHEGEHILIHAAAGGVGTALTQLAKWKGCTVYGTASNPEKIKYMKENGVDHAINYKTQDFVAEIKKLRKEGIDIVFDSIGGKTFKKSKDLLSPGGRIIGYGSAERSGGNKIMSGIKLLLGFGFFNPAFLIMKSQTMIGVNMLRIADHQPQVIKRCMNEIVTLVNDGTLKPHVGGRFKVDEIAAAHDFLSKRQSVGKIVVQW
ncbi:MAG: zinc-binding dehydrogenase [Flavobacteriales bacterium]|nr:zinc-binding dehydrogenase [Flavobacteriales bacterium]